MNQKLLKKHKSADKRLASPPTFKSLRRGRLPKPLDKFGGGRIASSDLISVGDSYHVCFAWRDGQILSDTAFFAWLFFGAPGKLFPLAILHHHPSHKPTHLLTPCRDDRDFTNRALPGVIEFNIADKKFDPRRPDDRDHLVHEFCVRCGITLGPAGGLI